MNSILPTLNIRVFDAVKLMIDVGNEW